MLKICLRGSATRCFILDVFSHRQATGEFLELLYSRMFFPLIAHPSRITAHKASLTLFSPTILLITLLVVFFSRTFQTIFLYFRLFLGTNSMLKRISILHFVIKVQPTSKYSNYSLGLLTGLIYQVIRIPIKLMVIS